MKRDQRRLRKGTLAKGKKKKRSQMLGWPMERPSDSRCFQERMQPAEQMKEWEQGEQVSGGSTATWRREGPIK